MVDFRSGRRLDAEPERVRSFSGVPYIRIEFGWTEVIAGAPRPCRGGVVTIGAKPPSWSPFDAWIEAAVAENGSSAKGRRQP